MSLTASRGRGYGSPPPVRSPLNRIGLLALALAGACRGGAIPDPAPADRLAYPTAIQYVAPPTVETGRLLIASSNFDLTYDRDDGAAVFSLPLASQTSAQSPLQDPLLFRVPTFTGQLTVWDPTTCGATGRQPLVFAPTRTDESLHVLTLGTDGSFSCGLGGGLTGCALGPAIPGVIQPFYVAVSCAPGRPSLAWIGYLSGTPDVSWLAVMDLSSFRQYPVAIPWGTPAGMAYDPLHDRLWIGIQNNLNYAPLRWIDLEGGACDLTQVESAGGCHQGAYNLFSDLRGADFGGIALDNPDAHGEHHRIYAAIKLYNADASATVGYRYGGDVGGAIAVFDVAEGPLDPVVTLERVIPVGIGMSEILVLPPRPGKRDVVLATAFEDGLLAVYDDDAGTIAKLYAKDPVTGIPILGRRPYAMALNPNLAFDATGGSPIVYVAAFDESVVTPIRIPLASPADAAFVDASGNPSWPTGSICNTTPSDPSCTPAATVPWFIGEPRL